MISLIRMLRDWALAPEASPTSADMLSEASSASASEWAEIWHDGSRDIPRSVEAQKLVRRGVPPQMRAEIWRRCADAMNHPREMAQPAPGYYEALLARAQEQARDLAHCARPPDARRAAAQHAATRRQNHCRA